LGREHTIDDILSFFGFARMEEFKRGLLLAESGVIQDFVESA
jgi:hypothetical protein